MCKALTSYLERTGRTQKWLAEQIPCREATVSGWVAGTTPRPKQMARIAAVTAGEVPVTAWFEAVQPEKAA